jgi:hypothetical protein
MTATALRADAPAEDHPEIAEAMALSDHGAGPRVAAARVRLEAAHRQARVIQGVGYKTIDFIFESAQREAGGQAAKAQLLAYLRAAIRLEAIIANPNLAPTRFAQDHADAVATAAAAGEQARSLGLVFNAHAFVASVRGRGISIAVDAAGKIVVAPASALNPTDRELVRTNKAAIVAILTDAERF